MATGGDAVRLSEVRQKRGAESMDIMDASSLEVTVNNNHASAKPVFYDVAYTRGGWIWRTSHRYRDWLALKETLRLEFGARSLPDEKTFPQKEDLGTTIRKIMASWRECRRGNDSVGIAEDRRRGLETYFAKILANKAIWDDSEEIKMFFFPGAPTAYSAALARQRSEKLKEEKMKAKGAISTSSRMASTIKSTFGTIFESTPSSTHWTSSSRPSVDAAVGMEDQVDGSASATPSVLNKISAKMPSLQNFFFDAAPTQPSIHRGVTSTNNTTNLQNLSSASTNNINKAPSESDVTDQDGISETGGSKHSILE